MSSLQKAPRLRMKKKMPLFPKMIHEDDEKERCWRERNWVYMYKYEASLWKKLLIERYLSSSASHVHFKCSESSFKLRCWSSHIINYFISQFCTFQLYSLLLFTGLFYSKCWKNWSIDEKWKKKTFQSVMEKKNDSCDGHGITMHSIYCLFIRLQWCLHNCPIVINEMKERWKFYMCIVCTYAQSHSKCNCNFLARIWEMWWSLLGQKFTFADSI